MLKRSYIRYYIICMTVPLNKWKVARKVEKKTSTCYHSYVHNINPEQDWELSKTFLRRGLHAQSKQKKTFKSIWRKHSEIQTPHRHVMRSFWCLLLNLKTLSTIIHCYFLIWTCTYLLDYYWLWTYFCLTHCRPMCHIYTPWEPLVFWRFRSIEMKQWLYMG